MRSTWKAAFGCFALCLGFLLLMPGAQSAEPVTRLVTPYACKTDLAIQKVSLSAPTIPRWERIEMTVELGAAYDNPFDPDDVALDARITTPSGETVSVPGFLYRPFKRSQQSGNEILTPAGDPSWRIRYAPSQVGDYSAVVVLRDRTGTVESKPVPFKASPSHNHGLVRVSSRDRHYFEFEDGQPMFPIGANICWAGRRGTFDYDAWLPRYEAAGCNYGRLWLSPNWTTFALEQAGAPADGKGMGQFDLANAWRIDYVLGLAAQHGLWLKLCIDSYNILREKNAYPQWDNTPHNAKNGGPLQQPTEFWTNAEMDRWYRHKLRYLVARYGAYRQVFAWEFWNEVDITTGYQTAPVRDWHQRMARALRALDPYGHLITTSFANTRGDPEIDRLPELDYAQTHHYGSADIVPTAARAQLTKATYGKPHYVGEIGADAGGPRRQDDREGLQVHDPLWVSVVTGGAASAQSWWWDNLIDPLKLYPLFTPLVRFTTDVDWPAERFHTVTPSLEWQDKETPHPRTDLLLNEGPVSWEKTEFNQPRQVRITRTGISGELPLAGIQHGLGGHRDQHNPVTFALDLPWPARFEVLVGDVSGYGGAVLQVSLDGKTALTREFPDNDPSYKTLTQFAGTYAIEVPAGAHTVVVENTGKDWFMVQYRLPGAMETRKPPVLAWGLVGKTTALAWARLEGRTWQNVCVQKAQIPPAAPSILVLPGVAPGSWKAEVWDTWGKGVLDTQSVSRPSLGICPDCFTGYGPRSRRAPPAVSSP